MGTLYLPIADILRAAGLFVVELDGWEYESRSTGGWDSLPVAVAHHHTAGGGSDPDSANYMKNVSDIAPVANIMPGHDGVVYVMAGGATNTNGSGNAMSFSRGTVPTSGANTRVIGMEVHNNGVGETYPKAQLDAAFACSNALNAYCGNQPTDVFSHNFYTLSDPNNPSGSARKIDPATAAAAAAGGWPNAGSINSSGTWSNDELRAECLRRSVPETPPGGEDVLNQQDKDWLKKQFKQVAQDVWDENIKVVGGEPGATFTARQMIGKIQRMGRFWLGGTQNDKPLPSPTRQGRIDQNVKELLGD